MIMRRSLAAATLSAALFSAGCTPDPEGLVEPFPSDGVSGFDTPALVDVCVGSARVVPGEAAAVCVPDGSSDSACSSDLECVGGERCLCGRCFVRACGPTTICPAGEACRGGRCTPSCTADAECAAGEVCSGGGCALPCESDAACRRGEICDFFGTCATEPCSEAAGCGASYACQPVTLSAEVREPHITEVGGEPFAFFELREAATSAVYRGRYIEARYIVADPPSPVLTAPSGHERAGSPSVLVRDGQLDLLATIDGTAIGLARSTNQGSSFDWVTAELLAPEEPWEAGAVGSPALFEWDGGLRFFYEGGPGAGIGLAAVAGDLGERSTPEPLLRPEDLEDAAFWRSVQTIGSPFVLVSGDIVRVYVSARGIEGGTAVTPAGSVPPEANDSIGMFASTDLASFDRFPSGPVFSSISGLFGALGEREPAVRLTDQGADLYFIATDASGTKVAGLSHATTVK